jgi:hypothetical protein
MDNKKYFSSVPVLRVNYSSIPITLPSQLIVFTPRYIFFLTWLYYITIKRWAIIRGIAGNNAGLIRRINLPVYLVMEMDCYDESFNNGASGSFTTQI